MNSLFMSTAIVLGLLLPEVKSTDPRSYTISKETEINRPSGEDKIKSNISGKNFQPKGYDQGVYSENYYEDGKWALDREGRVSLHFKGRWWLEKNRLCVLWNKGHQCRFVRLLGPGIILYSQLFSDDSAPSVMVASAIESSVNDIR